RFREPLGPYGPGHRGVDYAAPAGTVVRAAGSGRVSFAGDVAGATYVTVDHGGGVRTTYGSLAEVAVASGSFVARGAVLGSAGPPPDGHPPGVLHFGLRIGDRYVDPLLLFRA